MRTIFAALALCAVASTAAAQEPLDSVEARQQIMKFIGGQMRALGSMAQGRSEFNGEYVRNTGWAISAMSKSYPLLFPVGTETGGDTKALPSVFENSAKFAEMAAQLEMAGSQMQQANSLEAFQQSFTALGGTCKSCHSEFRR